MLIRFFLPLVALAGALFAAFSLWRSQKTYEPAEPPVPPPTADFVDSVAGIGLVEPSSESISIGTSLSGIVDAVLVKEGQSVEAGAPLFRLDVRHLEAELEIRRAAVATAKAAAQVAATVLDDNREQLARAKRLQSGNTISDDEFVRRQFAVKTAEARLAEAEAQVAAAEAQAQSVQTDIERSSARAPIDGTVLQVNVRPGQFADAGQHAEPLVVLGRLNPLHVRVDIDEHEAWRVRPGAKAIAHVRGNADLKAELKFVRFEPMVVPKRSLTGESTERVDTRVLQVIFEITGSKAPLFVGQQMDVFIDEAPSTKAPGPL